MSKYQWHLKADRKNGVIHNVSVMQTGPAIGHGFDVTATTLVTTFRELMRNQAEQGGTPTHYGHDEDGQIAATFGPDAGHMGGLTNPRLDDGRIVADLHLENWTRHVKHYATGNSVFDMLMRAAENDPGLCAMSPVVEYTIDDAGGVYVHGVDAVDVVDEGAVTRSFGVVAPLSRRGLLCASVCTSPLVGGRWDDSASIKAAMLQRKQQASHTTPPKYSPYQREVLRPTRKELAAILPKLNRYTVH